MSKSIYYTFLYVDENNNAKNEKNGLNEQNRLNGQKLFLSEPNPSFNKDLRETASRKHIYNLPAKDMVSQLIKESCVSIKELSAQRLENALYFGPFCPTESQSKDSKYKEAKNFEDAKNNLCVAAVFSKDPQITNMKPKSVYNGNLDYELKELMQEFATSSDVYFGWNNYYLCSYNDFRNYVLQTLSKEPPVIPSFEELSQSDSVIKEKIDAYNVLKAYADWLWWFPLWSGYRAAQVKDAKSIVDKMYEKKRSEAEKVHKEAIQYQKDLKTLLEDMDKTVADVPHTATNVSLLLEARS